MASLSKCSLGCFLNICLCGFGFFCSPYDVVHLYSLSIFDIKGQILFQVIHSYNLILKIKEFLIDWPILWLDI